MTFKVKASRYFSSKVLQRMFSSSLTFSVCIKITHYPIKQFPNAMNKSNEKSPISCIATLSENNKIINEGICEVFLHIYNC